ncbi:Exon junction complex, Pym [Penicillium griseofulvum]|uniref:Exon junction complex, Pym n=1 Tax=Penicillium patulum TaxID=5078 RepID=A0A135LGC4_PENPA|nr:Exon junction complex, Pym [Penicillium griseofulvum]KXG47995.1 Exon junction complex, Pym [Penicillium griseofulvum]
MSNVARSGITTDAQTGERYIPSSVRADGSKRKEIRVRPGYKPPEDIELYKNRAAAAWKSRAKGGVPGAEALSTEDKTKTAAIPTATTTTAASNKNAKRREAKRNAKENEEAGPLTEGKGAESSNWRVPAPAPKKQEKPAEELIDPEAEREKKARNLKKKLRQARDLRDKKQQGEALLPEQLEKVIKIQELVRQLDMLGFDSNGDKKDGDSNENA